MSAADFLKLAGLTRRPEELLLCCQDNLKVGSSRSDSILFGLMLGGEWLEVTSYWQAYNAVTGCQETVATRGAPALAHTKEHVMSKFIFHCCLEPKPPSSWNFDPVCVHRLSSSSRVKCMYRSFQDSDRRRISFVGFRCGPGPLGSTQTASIPKSAQAT